MARSNTMTIYINAILMIINCIFNDAILFRMCQLVVERDLKFVKFKKFQHVIQLLSFKRPERSLSPANRLEKDGTFFK